MQANTSGFALGQIARALRAAEINRANPAVAANASHKAQQRAAEWIRIAEVNFRPATPSLIMCESIK